MGHEDETNLTQDLKHLEGDVILDVQQPETPDDIGHPSCLLTGSQVEVKKGPTLLQVELITVLIFFKWHLCYMTLLDYYAFM